MYAKINVRNNTITLCKLIFNKSTKNMSDFNWIYNTTTGFAYNLCDCENLKDCKSKPIPKVDNPKMGKINISKKYKHLLVKY